jgi:hypothetical protein
MSDPHLPNNIIVPTNLNNRPTRSQANTPKAVSRQEVGQVLKIHTKDTKAETT